MASPHSPANCYLSLMLSRSNDLPRRRHLNATQRAEIVRLYERGEYFGPKLAEMFGVHRNTVYAILTKAGAVRGCRAAETLAPLIAELDERRRQKARMELARHQEWMKRSEDMARSMDAFMEALFAAEMEGSFAQFGRDLRALERAGRMSVLSALEWR